MPSQSLQAPNLKHKHLRANSEMAIFVSKILFLPVAHPELNPIEMVWGNSKHVVKNSTFQVKLELLEEYATSEMAKVYQSVFPKILQGSN